MRSCQADHQAASALVGVADALSSSDGRVLRDAEARVARYTERRS